MTEPVEPLGACEKMDFRSYLSIFIVSSTISFLIFGIIWIKSSRIIHENHLVEYTQALFLFIGFSCFIYSCFKSKSKPYIILYLCLGIFYLTFLVRELEPEDTNTWYAIIINPPIRNYWIITLWMIAFLIFIRNAKITFNAFFKWIKLKPGSHILIGGIYYLIADIFDRNIFHLSRNSSLFIEEVLELNATVFMVSCSILTLVWSKKQQWWGGS